MSDEYDLQEEFDSAFLNELDVIEATQLATAHASSSEKYSETRTRSMSRTPTQEKQQLHQQPERGTAGNLSSDFDFHSFDIGSDEIERLDRFIADSHAGKAQPQTSMPVGSLNKTRQTTLDGRKLPISPPKTQPSRSSSGASTSRTQAPLFGYRPKKTKFWDHTAFSETGWMSTKRKAKAAETLASKEEGSREYEEDVEFEQFPTPSTSVPQPPPMKLKPDLLAIRNWYFPLNKERRNYQYDIAHKCLFQNTLVALPTGLGKTFIAGVVMLNYYRWFPDGKIIFVAPTKPLVSQQIQACHDVCGIPGGDAAELTGNVMKSKRITAWAEKRVLYMTPQTLRNDFSTGLADPLDVILLVVDEAHRGTGDYAYAQVVRFMMAKNPHFRVLALTATPGNKPESVQAIVDALHISHIEIRNEQSPDVRKYIHNKTVQIHIVKMNDLIAGPKNLLAALMEPHLQKLRKAQIIYTTNPVLLHPYACQAAIGELHTRPNARALSWAYVDLKLLGMLARAMGYLMENSARMCFLHLKEMSKALKENDKPRDKQLRGILGTETYIKLMRMLEHYEVSGFPPHPKMDLLLSLVLSHFTNVEATESPDDTADGSDSKIMVFVQFRDCVEEIVRLFDQHQPVLRAAAFIGQGIDKQGRKGLAQSDQLGVIERFKKGEHNILVATSIGEEGLDIGEIDRIICYDSQKSAVRMLQRVGRTGRKRAGFVDVLVAEEREEKNWEKSKENYSDVQFSIISGNQLELYGDVERLIPDSVQPVCLAAPMEIEQYEREARKVKGSPKTSKGKKRTRNNDINRNIPLGALTGFVAASELRPKAKKAKASRPLQNSDLNEDSDDAEIVAGLFGSKRKRSAVEPKSKSAANPKTNKKGNGKRKSLGKNSKNSSLPERLEDDEDDEDIQYGIKAYFQKSKQQCSGDAGASASSASKPSPSPIIEIATSSPRIEDRALTAGTSSSRPRESPTPAASASANRKDASDWLLISDSGSEGESHVLESIASQKCRQGHESERVRDPEDTVTSPQRQEDPSAALITYESSDDDKYDERTSPLRDNTNDGKLCISPASSFSIRQRVARKAKKQPLPPSSPRDEEHSPAPRRILRRLRSPELMPPPPPPPPPGRSNFRKKAPVQRSGRSESDDAGQKSIQRTPSPRRSGKPKRPKRDMRSNPLFFDMEAQHSGEDVLADDDSSVEGASESDSDRRFLEELDPTQASPSYNQTGVYRLGLLTQLPAGVDGPNFARGPRRVGPFAGGRTQVPRPADYSSSPITHDESNEYEMGSFVVRDDDTLLYDNSSDV